MRPKLPGYQVCERLSAEQNRVPVLAGYDGKVGFGKTTRAALADLAADPRFRP
jgi:hypothetical protein